MKKHFLLFAVLLTFCGKKDVSDLTPQITEMNDINEVLISSKPEIRGTPFAFIHVNVITMVDRAILRNQTVIVKDGLIDYIGATAQADIPLDAEIIDAKGIGYLIPGLMDMHFHRSTVKDLFLFLANGVMVAREMWGSVALLDIRDQIVEENLDLPQLFVASPGMDGIGGPFAQFTAPVTEPDEARSLVQQYKREGFDFIKVYNNLLSNVYDAIIDEAKLQDIGVVGHVPFRVGPETVFQSGQVTTEHFIGFGYFASSQGTIFNGVLNRKLVDDLAELSVQNNLWHVATIEVDANSPIDIAAIRNSRAYQFISEALKKNFETGFFQGATNAVQSEINHKEVLISLQKVGSPLLLGTDSGFGYIIPGFSIYDELEHYVDAGLSNFEALETATINPAIFLNIENVTGTITVGKRADLILLECNPLENIANIRDKAGIVVRGTWLSEEFLMNELSNN